MKKLLLIDDSKTFLNILSSLLSKKYLIVGTAKDGVEGHTMYTTTAPDLVLLDITMPNCNGKECLKKIMETNRTAKVIMISSVGDEKTIDECLKLGAKAFIKKEEISFKCEKKILSLFSKIDFAVSLA